MVVSGWLCRLGRGATSGHPTGKYPVSGVAVLWCLSLLAPL